MTDQLMLYKEFSEQDIKDLLPAMKVGIMGTVTPEGLPHLTLITTLMA
ncbi:MAG: pyridoxamine 5'-phosphate oxidase family protein, partial [Chloroflexi bacterium]|nr:pyridoxamine 5'-phosphate oxidase family protein [Chloroflexota bacterium]